MLLKKIFVVKRVPTLATITPLFRGLDESSFTTYFISTIAFGNITIVEDDNKRRVLLEELCEKYAPGDAEGRNHEMNKAW